MEQIRSGAWMYGITVINIIILFGLPFMLGYHVTRIRKFAVRDYEWYLQILYCLVYVSGIGTEIPAFLSRYLSYFYFKVEMPEVILSISAWDRTARSIFYIVLFICTYTSTKSYVPKTIRDILD